MTLETLIDDLGFWDKTYRDFTIHPDNSKIRQAAGQKIYNDPNIFSSIATDVVDNEIQTQYSRAKSSLIQYMNEDETHLQELFNKFNDESLFIEALNFYENYAVLKANATNPKTRAIVLIEKYNLTPYSAMNGEFTEKVYAFALKTEEKVLRKKLSIDNKIENGLDRKEVNRYIKNGLSKLDDNHKAEYFIEAVLKLYYSR